jgi:hypothetical protein
MRTIVGCFALSMGLSLALAGCGRPEGDRCSFASDCGGDTFCCTSKDCDNGLCTYACAGDRDCPDDMLCRDDVCLFTCGTDADCDFGFQCRDRGGRLLCTGD